MMAGALAAVLDLYVKDIKDAFDALQPWDVHFQTCFL